MAATYRSKIDTWLIVVLVSAMAITAGALYFAALVEKSIPIWPMVLGGLPGVLLPVWVLLGTHYALDEDTLKVQCGPFRTSIAIKDIHLIESTRSALSSPALSLDRLRIDYGNNQSLMISPRDSKQFLKELESMRKHC